MLTICKDDPRALAVRQKPKELQVVSRIASTYGDYFHDKPLFVNLERGCCATKRRIDFKKLINGTMLCIEINQGQHENYIQTDKERRYNDLFMGFINGKYTFVRYTLD